MCCTFAAKINDYSPNLTNKMNANESAIAEAFELHHDSIVNYVRVRINDKNEAEDITQDIFVRLLGYDLINKETIKSLCFTIANNLVIDHLRRHYKRQEVYSYAYDMMQKRQVLTPEQEAIFHELAERERCLIKDLTPATARVYEMKQMKGLSIEEISQELSISRRTVECHLFRGRKYVRQQIRKII